MIDLTKPIATRAGHKVEFAIFDEKSPQGFQIKSVIREEDGSLSFYTHYLDGRVYKDRQTSYDILNVQLNQNQRESCTFDEFMQSLSFINVLSNKFFKKMLEENKSFFQEFKMAAQDALTEALDKYMRIPDAD